MSLAKPIEKTQSSLNETYALIDRKGGIVPEEQNLENLSDSILTIPIFES